MDVSANTALTSLYCGTNSLTTLDVSANTALAFLSCYHNQLTNLDISTNTNTVLAILQAQGNLLTTLDVSTNTALTWLFCSTNKLASLDVSTNTALTNLGCRNNELTELNVSANTTLTILDCRNNELTSLNVANGNNNNFTLTYGNNRVADSFKATSNPNLRCIQVDNVAYSTANWTNKSGIASYSEDCSSFVLPALSTTAIPDPNFERKLISLGYDSGEIDGVVYTDNIADITSLDVSNEYNTPNSEKITNLSDIEVFTALTRLECGYNQLTTLDFSANMAYIQLVNATFRSIFIRLIFAYKPSLFCRVKRSETEQKSEGLITFSQLLLIKTYICTLLKVNKYEALNQRTKVSNKSVPKLW